jgi:hypothetical protein
VSPAVQRNLSPLTFAHVLSNVGFGDDGELSVMAQAWRNLYEFVRPDLIVFDYSPTAMLAARGFPAKRAVVGTGFHIPPDMYPLPTFCPWQTADVEKLRADEDCLLERINRILASRGQPPLERLGQLCSQMDETFLCTYQELDHYPQRTGATYWGCWSLPGGKSPQWPEGHGQRIFAYLKPFPALPHLLQTLCRLGHPTIVYGGGIDASLQQQLAAPTLRFENEPLDLAEVGRQCDLALLNGTHTSTAMLLLAGKPLLLIPLALEQGIVTRAVERMGAGVGVASGDSKALPEKLSQIVQSKRHTEAASRFRETYCDVDPMQSPDRIAGVLDELSRSDERRCVP